MQAETESEFAYWVRELREAIAAEWAEPLPCSGVAAFNRSRRVTLARLAVAQWMAR